MPTTKTRRITKDFRLFPDKLPGEGAGSLAAALCDRVEIAGPGVIRGVVHEDRLDFSHRLHVDGLAVQSLLFHPVLSHVDLAPGLAGKGRGAPIAGFALDIREDGQDGIRAGKRIPRDWQVLARVEVGTNLALF